jgi:hypothetical protein
MIALAAQPAKDGAGAATPRRDTGLVPASALALSELEGDDNDESGLYSEGDDGEETKEDPQPLA